jgi:thiol-disulfide isomerase/thioredoxin
MKTLLSLFLLGMLAGCMSEPPAPKVVKPEGQPVPEFKVLLRDTTTWFNTKDIPKGKPFLLMFYGQNCVPCESLLSNVLAHPDSINTTKIYLLSADYFHNLGAYEDSFHLSKYDFILSGLDPGIFFSYFGSNVFPLTVVYNEQKKLKQIVVGQVSLDSLEKVIKR